MVVERVRRVIREAGEKRKFRDTPVGREIRNLERIKDPSIIFDPYITNLRGCLTMLEERGFWGQEYLESVLDYLRSKEAERDPLLSETMVKRWEEARGQALTERTGGARVIKMNLDPEYFVSILDREKTYEGRAWDPDSDKNYVGIQEGDIIEFSINHDYPEVEEVCSSFGIKPHFKMRATVGKMIFAPSIHYMWRFNPQVDPDLFQPKLRRGDMFMEAIESAAVYYRFSDYPRKINENGFLGIEVLHPTLISN